MRLAAQGGRNRSSIICLHLLQWGSLLSSVDVAPSHHSGQATSTLRGPTIRREARASPTATVAAQLTRRPACASFPECSGCPHTHQIVATGLGLQQLSLPAPAAAGNSSAEQRLVVSFVVEDSPAAAGVQDGDVVLSVAGQPIGSQDPRWGRGRQADHMTVLQAVGPCWRVHPLLWPLLLPAEVFSPSSTSHPSIQYH